MVLTSTLKQKRPKLIAVIANLMNTALNRELTQPGQRQRYKPRLWSIFHALSMLMTSSHFIYQMAVIKKICPRVELLAASKFKKR